MIEKSRNQEARGDSILARNWRSFLPLVILVAGLLAYHNSFSGPFIFDDEIAIVDNPKIRSLSPLWAPLLGTMRPVVDFSFAVQYFFGTFNVSGYHAVNLLIHVLAGLTLFGVLRRTLRGTRLKDRFGQKSSWLALAISLLWVVHPLNTQSVTFIVQRGESLMGLFFLLALYCVIRGFNSSRKREWNACAVACSFMGMGCKPIMVTAPLVILLFDYTFLSRSFRALWQRKELYAGLFFSYGLLVLLFVTTPKVMEVAMGPRPISPLAYASAQPSVILHYLKLALWPHPLVLDYHGWEVPRSLQEILPPLLAIGTLLGAVTWAAKRYPGMAFLGASFFVLLIPTSSFFPLADIAFEHRMYLPLICVITVFVILGTCAAERAIPKPWSFRLSVPIVLILVLLLGFATIKRNHQYRSVLTIWEDTLRKRPNSERALNNIGAAYAREGDYDKAIPWFQAALRRDADYPEALNNIGTSLLKQGKVFEARTYLYQATRIKPDYAMAHRNLGLVLFEIGNVEEAILHYRESLHLRPEHDDTHNYLGLALVDQGKIEEAMAEYRIALSLNPNHVGAHNNLGIVLMDLGKHQEAIEHYEKALALDPEYPQAHNNLGIVLAEQGAFEAASTHFRKAISLKKDYAKAHNNFGAYLLRQGRVEEAMAHFSEALRIDPNYVGARKNMGIASTRRGKSPEQKP